MNPEEIQKAMDEIADKTAAKVKEAILPVVTKEVVEKVMDQIPKVQNLGGEDAKEKKLKEEKEKAAEYFKGVVEGDRSKVRAHAKAEVFGNEGTATEGQELAPEYFEKNIIEIAYKYGLVRQKATKVPLPGRKVTWPTGGSVTAYKVAEGAAIKARKPAYSTFSMAPEKLGVLIPVTKELIEDSSMIPGLIDYLNLIAGRAFAKLEDDMGLGGAGASAGEGVMKKSGVSVKTMASATAFSSFTFEELLEMTELIDDAVDQSKLEWVMSRSVRNILLNARLAISTDKQEFIFANPGGNIPRQMWDLPMTLHPSMPARADSGAAKIMLALVDWANVWFGDRRAYRVEMSDVASFVGTDDSTTVNAFAQDIVVLKFTERIDVELANHTKAFALYKTHA